MLGQAGRGGVRWRSRALSPASDSEDSFDGLHTQHHQQDVQLFERLVLDSPSRRRRVSRAPPSPAGNGRSVWLNDRNAPILTTMMPVGRPLERVYEFGARRRIQLTLEAIVRSALGAPEMEDTCRESETPESPERGTPAVPRLATLPGRGFNDEDSLAPGDNLADPLLDARVLGVQRNSSGDRHGAFRNAVSELVQSPWVRVACVRPPHFLVVLQMHE